jgi:hypothetical protein
MSKTIKLKQSDIEKIVSNIVSENLDINLDEVDTPTPDQTELKLGRTETGGYILYKTNEDGSDEIVRKFEN